MTYELWCYSWDKFIDESPVYMQSELRQRKKELAKSVWGVSIDNEEVGRERNNRLRDYQMFNRKRFIIA